jgi:hypothetical protein
MQRHRAKRSKALLLLDSLVELQHELENNTNSTLTLHASTNASTTTDADHVTDGFGKEAEKDSQKTPHLYIGLDELELVTIVVALIATLDATTLVAYSQEDMLNADIAMIKWRNYTSPEWGEYVASHYDAVTEDGYQLPVDPHAVPIPFWYDYYGNGMTPVSGGYAFYISWSCVLTFSGFTFATFARIIASFEASVKRSHEAHATLVKFTNPLIAMSLFICIAGIITTTISWWFAGMVAFHPSISDSSLWFMSGMTIVILAIAMIVYVLIMRKKVKAQLREYDGKVPKPPAELHG